MGEGPGRTEICVWKERSLSGTEKMGMSEGTVAASVV